MILCFRPIAEVCRARNPVLPLVFCRQKSLRAAIERGIQSSETATASSRQRRTPLQYKSKRAAETEPSYDKIERAAQPPRRRTASLQSSSTSRGAGKGRREQEKHVPETLETFPYTTAASEFIYGYSAVYAAIRARRRKLYKLYIHERGQSHGEITKLIARARAYNVEIHQVGPEYLRIMDKVSNGRPHNGFILESSPLPQPPIVRMASSFIDAGFFKVELDKQSREDAEVNGTQTRYAYKSGGWRHPLLLYVDGVLDQGNLGAIARSAYFLGVDAIATPSRQSAPWSNIALKASAGAAEAIPIFSVNKPSEFLGESARNGWRIYASDAIPQEKEWSLLNSSALSSQAPIEGLSSEVIFTFARSTKRMPPNHCPVGTHPTILMMGSEDTGLRTSLLNQAHYKVGIRAGQATDDVGVDSLNVSVAASILCFEFLKKPKVQSARTPGDLLF